MARENDGEEADSLDVIDLGREFGVATKTSRPRRRRLRSRWAVLAAVIVGVSALAVAFAVTNRSGGDAHATRERTDSAVSSDPNLGRFYPTITRTGTTTIVLPSGLTVTLSGGLREAIGGLGASFSGSVTYTDPRKCCSVRFRILHGAPTDLFESLGPDTGFKPAVVSSAHAKVNDLKSQPKTDDFNGYTARYGILTTGDWTLVATFGDAEYREVDDADLLRNLDSWNLRSTPSAAELEVPADRTIEESSVFFGRVPDLSDRAIELTQSVEPTQSRCRLRSDTARRIYVDANNSAGTWCVHGIFVRIEGPRSFVERAVADFNVDPNAEGIWRPLDSSTVTTDGGSYFGTTILAVGDDALVLHASPEERVAGEIVDLDTGTARTIARSSLPWGGGFATAWTGTDLLAWSPEGGGGAYNPATDSWRAIREAPETAVAGVEASAWTGQEMLVLPAGLAYNPETDSWRHIADSPLVPRYYGGHAWTGSELLVWGGCELAKGTCSDPLPGDELGDGAIYNPATNAWRPMARAPIAGRDYFDSVWTGTEMIVWGGITDPDSPLPIDGAAYNPVRDSWRVLPPAPIENRTAYSATWTGQDVIIWAGSIPDEYADGARFDPISNEWQPIPNAPAGPRRAHAAAWIDGQLVVAGGYPNASTWSYTPRINR